MVRTETPTASASSGTVLMPELAMARSARRFAWRASSARGPARSANHTSMLSMASARLSTEARTLAWSAGAATGRQPSRHAAGWSVKEGTAAGRSRPPITHPRPSRIRVDRIVVGPQKRTPSSSNTRLLEGKAKTSCADFCPGAKDHVLIHHHATRSSATGPAGIRVKSTGSSFGNNGPLPVTSSDENMTRLYKRPHHQVSYGQGHDYGT